MRSKLKRSWQPWLLALTAALVALLAALAALQYRWLGRVSEAERERMQAYVRAGAARFAQDFDRELGRIYFGLQSDAQTWRRRDAGAYAARYDEWRRGAADARLVREVYVMAKGVGGAPARLVRFDPAGRAFASAAWPDELAALRRRLESSPADLRGGAPRQLPPLPSVDADLPAVVIPVVPEELPEPGSGERRLMLADIPPPSAYAVAVLDRDYLTREFLPALARRYFADGDRLDYRLALVRQHDGQIAYRSDAGAAAALAASDARVPAGQIRFEESDPSPPRAGGKIIMGERLEERGVREQSVTRRVFKGAPREVTSRVMLKGAEGAAWQLLVAHPAGSLEAAVAGGRRRSLVVSFGVLLLLAASLALVMLAAHRAQRLARQQVEFVAGVSHELRTPLSVICSAGENLADGVVDDRRQVRRYGAVIRDEGRRLAEMVEQVLEFAGARSGRQNFRLAPVAVPRLIESALAGLPPEAQTEPLQIERDLGPDLPPVLADEQALRRSLQNLLSNAVKYGGGARWIRIEARAAAGARGTPEVRIRVEDRGGGIAPGELAHIFEPFYRGRGAVAAQIHGSGLGLSLVKHIVEAHGGRVSVESAPGRGSAFTLHLPAAVKTDAEGAREGAEAVEA